MSYGHNNDIITSCGCFRVNIMASIWALHASNESVYILLKWFSIGIKSQIVRFMGPTWGPPGDDRTQVGPMNLAIRAHSRIKSDIKCLEDKNWMVDSSCPSDTIWSHMTWWLSEVKVMAWYEIHSWRIPARASWVDASTTWASQHWWRRRTTIFWTVLISW